MISKTNSGMQKQDASQENIDKLVEHINDNYNIKTWKHLFFPYIICLSLKGNVLSIDTSRSYQFELTNDELIFTNYFKKCESINLKEYCRDVSNE